MSPRAKADLDMAMHAYQHYTVSMQNFQQAVTTGDEETAEQIRPLIIGSLESFLDNYAAAFMRHEETN